MRPGQQSPRKLPPQARHASSPALSFNEAGATIAPETSARAVMRYERTLRFNEAGATIAPETAHGWPAIGRGNRASMRPGQQSPRKRERPGSQGHDPERFNEAGATIAPETIAGHIKDFDEACLLQ